MRRWQPPGLQNIVIGQKVEPEKVEKAQEMRRSPTRAEQALWERLRGSRLGANFRRQQVIAGFIADFYCYRAALVVEVDGPTHDAEYDRERDRVFAGKGITVLRFENEEVLHRIGSVIYRIKQHLKANSQADADSTAPPPPASGGESPQSGRGVGP